MNSLFYACPDLNTFQTLKLASDETNTEYFTYTSNTIIFGEPDVKWGQICFVFDEESPLIYVRGKIIYDYAELEHLNDKIGDLGNKVEAIPASYYTQAEADAYNTENSLNAGELGYVTTSSMKTLPIPAVPYDSVMDVILDNERISTIVLNNLNTGKEDKSNKVTYIDGDSTDDQYPSAKAVYTYIGDTMSNFDLHDSTKEDVSNKVISINGDSTDDQYPSAKAVYSYVGETMSNFDLHDSTKEDVSNKVISINGDSTDDQYPSAYAIYKLIGYLGNKVEAQPAFYFTQEEADAYNEENSLVNGDPGYVTTESIKIPAVSAIPYTSVMDVIKTNEIYNSLSINDLQYYKEDASNKVSYIDANSTDEQYPSAYAVYSYISNVISNIDLHDDTKEDVSNKVISIDSESTDDQYPSAKAVYSYVGGAGFITNHQDISGKEDTSNKVTSIDSNSTDTQYPSAKAVYSYVGGAGFITNHQDISGKEDVINKVSYINSESTNIQYPSAYAVYKLIGNLGNKVEYVPASYYTQAEADAYNEENELESGDIGYVTTESIKEPAIEAVPYTSVMDVVLDNESVIVSTINNIYSIKEDISNKVTSIDSTSTDDQYPSAKAVWEKLSYIESKLNDIELLLSQI